MPEMGHAGRDMSVIAAKVCQPGSCRDSLVVQTPLSQGGREGGDPCQAAGPVDSLAAWRLARTDTCGGSEMQNKQATAEGGCRPCSCAH